MRVYFVNYKLGGTAGDSHLYRLAIATGQVEKIA
jgi:hypothetical protein